MPKDSKKIETYGKIFKFPKNTQAHKAYNFLENIKISKKKLWYFIVEKEYTEDNNGEIQELQLIKYNNKRGVNCVDFINELKKYYSKDERLIPLVEQLKVEGKEDFSIIKNIPDIIVDGKKFITIITQDLIKLLK
jgi:hypothetical protein